MTTAWRRQEKYLFCSLEIYKWYKWIHTRWSLWQTHLYLASWKQITTSYWILFRYDKLKRANVIASNDCLQIFLLQSGFSPEYDLCLLLTTLIGNLHFFAANKRFDGSINENPRRWCKAVNGLLPWWETGSYESYWCFKIKSFIYFLWIDVKTWLVTVFCASMHCLL